MTWLELYDMLHKKAHDFKNIEENQSFWQSNVEIYDCETGDEFQCDLLEFNIKDGKKMVLSINIDSITYE